MPTYEYKCDACGALFEKFQSMTARPIKECPTCRKPKARRLISAGAGLIFKGSGFYITDYRSDGYKQAAKSESGGGSGTAGGDGAASKPAESKPAESKPAASKTESKASKK